MAFYIDSPINKKLAEAVHRKIVDELKVDFLYD